jgi:hypothetical protein
VVVVVDCRAVEVEVDDVLEAVEAAAGDVGAARETRAPTASTLAKAALCRGPLA